MPYVGLGMEELDPGDWKTDLTLTLTGVSGSGVDAGGGFSLYTVDLFGTPTAFMSTKDGISAADSVSQAAGKHEHYNWAFSKQGRYDLTLDVTGTHAVDGPQAATATFSFNAGPLAHPVPESSSTASTRLGF